MVALPKPRPASVSDIDLFEKDLRSEMRRLVSENMSLGDPESFDFAMPKGYTKESTGSALIGDTNIPDPMNNIPLMISDDPDIIRADRRRQAKEFGEGLALGITTDLLGLPADILALVFRDAPELAAALTKSITTGTPVAEEIAAMNANPSLLDQALTVVQKYAGGDALAGYLGYSPEQLQRSGVLAGRIGAAAFDPFVLLGAGSKAKQVLQGEILPPEQGPSSQGIASQGPIIEGDINQEGIGTLLPAPQTSDLVSDIAQQPTRLQATGDITDIPRENIPDVGEVLDFSRPDADAALGEMELFQFEGDMIHTATGTRIPAGSTVRGDITDFESAGGRDANFVVEPNEGGILDFTPPDADPGDEMDIFSFGVEMVHTPTGARIPPETIIRGRFSEFETVEGRDASLVNRTEITQRMATPEETAAVMRGEDPAEVAPIDAADASFDHDFLPPNADPESAEFMSFGEEMVHTPTGRRVPAGSTVRALIDELENFETVGGRTDEGIATLPAAEDVIDVEPVAQAALTPIRTEGQQQLRQQAFPITEDMDVFEPSGMSELGPTYFGLGRDYSTIVPGSGQRGIATTFDFGGTDTRMLQRQGEVADYSPSFQTLDRLPDRDYTKQQIIEFLEAQPEAAMRDLKGSGFIEYLRSPYAPDTYDSVADLRTDYIIHTPQLRVKTVTNNDIAEQQARLEADPDSVKPSELLPFSTRNNRDSKLPYSGQQTFFEDGTDQAPFDRGVIILNNPNTSTVIGQQLRAPSGHNYFGGSAGVPGYIAHSRYSVVLSPIGKKIAVMEETQGNTVSSAARGQSISATPLEKARATYLNRNENYKRHSELDDSVSSNRRLLQDAQEAFEKKSTGEIQSYNESYVTRGMLADRPGEIMPNPFYNMVFDAFQKDLRNAEGVFDIGQRNETTIFRAPAYGDNLASVLRRNTTPEQQQLITETFDSNQIPANKMLDQAGDTREPEIATFENLAGETNMLYIIRNNMRYLKDQGTLDDRGKQLLEIIDLDSPANKDLQIRAVFEGDALEKYIDKLEDASTAKYREARQQIEQEFSSEEFDEMTLAHESVQEGRMVPGQPFATTRDFDEYMPRLTLQELIRRGDIDEVVFPSPDALMNISGRSSFRGGPEEAGFRNTYGKGVKKGLNKIKAENPDFKIETIENYTPGGDPTDNVTLIGSSTVINLRDPAVRSVFEDRLIRRAKGGEVDLRPRKMIHSGIGAMAKEVM